MLSAPLKLDALLTVQDLQVFSAVHLAQHSAGVTYFVVEMTGDPPPQNPSWNAKRHLLPPAGLSAGPAADCLAKQSHPASSTATIIQQGAVSVYAYRVFKFMLQVRPWCDHGQRSARRGRG